MSAEEGRPADQAGIRVAQDQLLAAYAEMASLLTEAPDVVHFLEVVAGLTARVLPEPVSCGVTMLRGTQIATIAATSQLATQADEVQYGLGEGPCLDAMRECAMVHVPDLAQDSRWGRYRVNAVAHGVRSSLSWPLVVDERGVGALNLYAGRPHHFTAVEIAQAQAFAEQVSTLLAVVMRQVRQGEVSDQLQQALVSRAVIDQALGIIMAQQRCSASDAFDVLRRASQHRNRKLVDIAGDLIRAATGHSPEPPRPFSGRS